MYKKINLVLCFVFLSFLTQMGCGDSGGGGNDESETGGDPDFNTLSDGNVLEATLDGQNIEIADGDLSFSIYGENIPSSTSDHSIDQSDLPLFLSLSGETVVNHIYATINLSTDDITSSLSTGTTYNLNGTDLGNVRFVDGGTTTTFPVKSVLLRFTTLNVTDNGNVSGDIQISFDDASDILTANFDGLFVSVEFPD